MPVTEPLVQGHCSVRSLPGQRGEASSSGGRWGYVIGAGISGKLDCRECGGSGGNSCRIRCPASLSSLPRPREVNSPAHQRRVLCCSPPANSCGRR
jgi:hypothetical protein